MVVSSERRVDMLLVFPERVESRDIPWLILDDGVAFAF
jgi:hypothetical protein